jgi:hypothetical protein
MPVTWECRSRKPRTTAVIDRIRERQEFRPGDWLDWRAPRVVSSLCSTMVGCSRYQPAVDRRGQGMWIASSNRPARQNNQGQSGIRHYRAPCEKYNDPMRLVTGENHMGLFDCGRGCCDASRWTRERKRDRQELDSNETRYPRLICTLRHDERRQPSGLNEAP